jgi:DNA-binding NarL/FixJ family response regulator
MAGITDGIFVMSETSKSKSRGPWRIFMVEDHPTFREGLAQIFNAEKDLTVCGEAATAGEALQRINRLNPDLVLVDITLPGASGLELIKKLRKTNRTVKLLVLSMHDEALYVNRVLRAGGDGYIMKQESPEEIVSAIRDVLAGRIYVSEEVLASNRKFSAQPAGAKVIIRPLDQLTDDELEELELLGRGMSDQEIARQLGLRAGQLAAAGRRIRKSLNLSSANALIRYAVCWVESGRADAGSRFGPETKGQGAPLQGA